MLHTIDAGQQMQAACLCVSRSLSGSLSYGLYCMNMVFELHLDSYGKHWLSTGRYVFVREISLQNRRDSHTG